MSFDMFTVLRLQLQKGKDINRYIIDSKHITDLFNLNVNVASNPSILDGLSSARNSYLSNISNLSNPSYEGS
jgi:hypothetical protein